jgi:hypothetical protein
MDLQGKDEYRDAMGKFLRKETPINTIFQKKFLEEMHRNILANLPPYGEPLHLKWENEFKEVLTKLGQHDEYYLILDLRTMEVEWRFGLTGALGYSEEDEENWSFQDQHRIIHDDYYPMFFAFGNMAQAVLLESGIKLESLKDRYMINIPLKKKNGTYVWAKQMSLPLSVDSEGRMVRQLNSYTIISRFDGIYLPYVPLMFSNEGMRAVELEKELFDKYVEASLFNLEPIDKKIFETALKIWRKKIQSQQESGSIVSVEHKEIAANLRESSKFRYASGTIRNRVSLVRQEIKEKFGKSLPTIVDISLFLRSLRRLE